MASSNKENIGTIHARTDLCNHKIASTSLDANSSSFLWQRVLAFLIGVLIGRDKPFALLERIMHLKFNEPLPGERAQREMSPGPAFDEPSRFGVIPSQAVEAAVLALLFPENQGRSREALLEWSVLLIRRNFYPGVHSGQISFPGGKRDKEDADLWATACRETREEVGIGPENLDRVGALTRIYVPASNFLIYPFVAVARPETKIVLDLHEAVECRRVPVKVFDPAAAEVVEVSSSIGFKLALAWQYGGFTIWGATGMMLAELYRTVDLGLLV